MILGAMREALVRDGGPQGPTPPLPAEIWFWEPGETAGTIPARVLAGNIWHSHTA